MSASHTPGPWSVYEPNLEVLAPSGDMIADVEIWHGRDVGEFEANARLIAAAPEMFDLLRHMVDAFHGPALDVCCGEGFADKVRAVVAKVTGT